MTSKNSQYLRKARARRTRRKSEISGNPRLVVFRSNRAIYAHIFDPAAQKIICGQSSLTSKKSGVAAAAEVGENLAAKAKKAKISSVAFDRNGYPFHGQVKSLADSARKGGLKF